MPALTVANIDARHGRAQSAVEEARQKVKQLGDALMEATFSENLDPVKQSKIAKDRALAMVELQAAEAFALEAGDAASELRSRALAEGARLAFDAATAKRAEIATAAAASLARLRELVGKLATEQKALEALTAADWDESARQGSANSAAKLGQYVPARLVGLGLASLNFAALTRELAQDEMNLKAGR
jgi:hypothetical protein